jgi:hypothetical protein
MAWGAPNLMSTQVATATFERRTDERHPPFLAVLVVAEGQVVVDVGEPGFSPVVGDGSRLEGRPRWRDGEASLWINIHK